MENVESRSFSELMSELIALADEVVSLAKDSDTEREIFTQFAVHVEKFSPIFNELREKDKFMDSPTIRKAVESFERELKRCKALIESPYSSTSVSHVEETSHELGRSLGLLLFASLDVSTSFKEISGDLHKALMNVRFSSNSSPTSSRESEFASELKGVGEIIEERTSLHVDDVVLQLKYGNDEEFKFALGGLNELIGSQKVSNELINEEGIIPILFNRLGSSKPYNRLATIQVLRRMAWKNADNKVYHT
jgi:vacuolar protein 8